jgi:hypothetical protein
VPPNAHGERRAKRVRSSVGLLGAVPPGPAGRHHIQKGSKCAVDGPRIREHFGYVGFQQDDVRSFSVSGYVLPSDSSSKVVLGAHRVTITGPLSSLPHMSVSLGGSPAAR